MKMAEEKKQEVKRRPTSKTWTYYEAKGELKRLKRTCPKCSEATYMAEHKDRYTCGKCGYTEFKGN